MSIPRNHHYLPQFYLDRWATGGRLVRYTRPRGPAGPLECSNKAPKGIAYERDLYRLPYIDDPAASQRIELRLFQEIDDRAAIALQRVDEGITLGRDDRIALGRFMVSLLHRSPSRLAAIRTELAAQPDAPVGGLEGAALEQALKSLANHLLEMLVGTDLAATPLIDLIPHPIKLPAGSKTLLTSDRPVSASAQLISPDAFLVLPFGPDRLIVFTKIASIARSFASQPPNVLVRGMNGAVVEQAEDLVVAADRDAARMVDRLFLRPQPDTTRDAIGLIRRKAPLIDLFPRPRVFSRHDKAGLKYLGR